MNTITHSGTSSSLFTVHSRTLCGKPSKCINARELHDFLDVGRRFATWITDRIKHYGFERSQDYITASRVPKPGSGNRGASTDYFISIDMAKELSMVERNDKGRQARRYFINCEKSLKAKLEQESKQADLPLEQPRLATKYLVEVTNGQLGALTPISEECCIVPISKIPSLLKERIVIDPQLLLEIGQVCMDRLARKALTGRH